MNKIVLAYDKQIFWKHGHRRTSTYKNDRVWHTDDLGGAEIEYRRADYEHNEDPGWYLYKDHIFGKYLALRLPDAFQLASELLVKLDRGENIFELT